MPTSKTKIIIPIALSLYFIFANYRLVTDFVRIIPFGIINVGVHEFGHIFFQMLNSPQFITVAGGTIFQIATPLICALYFYFSDQKLSSSIMILWLGNSLFDISVYAKDAIFMELPLTTPYINFISSADELSHDWNYMLRNFNILHKAELVGNIIITMGIITTLVGILFLFNLSLKDQSSINHLNH
jgi:hypothetical protein